MDSNGNKNITLEGLQLPTERYLELKARERVIAGWVKIISDKTGVQINLEDLEKAV